MGIGQKIKEYRIQKGLTQKDLADKLHVTYQAVSKWENDNTEPSFDTIKEMSKLFGCTIDELFDYDGNNEENDNVVNEQAVIVEQPKTLLGVCTECGKSIYDPNDLNKVKIEQKVGKGKDQYLDVKTQLYCNSCNQKRIEQEKRLAQMKQDRITSSCRKRRIHSIIWPSIVSIILLIIGVTSFPKGNTNMGIAFVVAPVFAFTFLACMILNNTFLTDMWLEIFSWGFVKLPGLIFEFSIDGILWLIGMKILFWILGFVLALLAACGATALAMVLSIFVYPFALRRNIKHIGVE